MSWDIYIALGRMLDPSPEDDSRGTCCAPPALLRCSAGPGVAQSKESKPGGVSICPLFG